MNKEISATEAANLCATNPNAVLLDVREDSELAICRVDGALHIPMGEIPARYQSLPKEEPLIVFCHHGMRSLNVVQFLETKGFENAISMGGGIHAWSFEVDPEVRRY